MKNLSFVLAVLFALSIFQSCVKDDATDPTTETAPDLPPVESFIMPFQGFEDADTTGILPPGDDGGAEMRTVTFFNWFYGATNVVVWNGILTLNLAIPVAAFYESFNHQPSYEGNGTWLWAYDVTSNGTTYQAKLYGHLLAGGTSVEWEMYVSQAGGFTDVLWYSGTTSDNGANATWTLQHQPNNPQPFISAEYEKDDGNGVESIRYTNIIPGNAGNGGYIEFRKSSDNTVDLNRAYDIYKAETDNLLEIQWHDPNKNGRVRDEAHFNDTEWHCWNEDLQDIDC